MSFRTYVPIHTILLGAIEGTSLVKGTPFEFDGTTLILGKKEYVYPAISGVINKGWAVEVTDPSVVQERVSSPTPSGGSGGSDSGTPQSASTPSQRTSAIQDHAVVGRVQSPRTAAVAVVSNPTAKATPPMGKTTLVHGDGSVVVGRLDHKPIQTGKESLSVGKILQPARVLAPLTSKSDLDTPTMQPVAKVASSSGVSGEMKVVGRIVGAPPLNSKITPSDNPVMGIPKSSTRVQSVEPDMPYVFAESEDLSEVLKVADLKPREYDSWASGRTPVESDLSESGDGEGSESEGAVSGEDDSPDSSSESEESMPDPTEVEESGPVSEESQLSDTVDPPSTVDPPGESPNPDGFVWDMTPHWATRVRTAFNLYKTDPVTLEKIYVVEVPSVVEALKARVEAYNSRVSS